MGKWKVEKGFDRNTPIYWIVSANHKTLAKCYTRSAANSIVKLHNEEDAKSQEVDR